MLAASAQLGVFGELPGELLPRSKGGVKQGPRASGHLGTIVGVTAGQYSGQHGHGKNDIIGTDV